MHTYAHHSKTFWTAWKYEREPEHADARILYQSEPTQPDITASIAQIFRSLHKWLQKLNRIHCCYNTMSIRTTGSSDKIKEWRSSNEQSEAGKCKENGWLTCMPNAGQINAIPISYTAVLPFHENLDVQPLTKPDRFYKKKTGVNLHIELWSKNWGHWTVWNSGKDVRAGRSHLFGQ